MISGEYNDKWQRELKGIAMINGSESVDIKHFRPRRPGPELDVEDAVIRSIPVLMKHCQYPLWAGSSLTIGAGMPDVVIAAYTPEIAQMEELEIADIRIVSYLRKVNRARLETICRRSQQQHNQVATSLEKLLEAKAIWLNGDAYSLTEQWRNILPEIVTIEAKARDWQKAVCQAARNRIFSHRSFIAVPVQLAERIKKEPILNQLGLGLLSANGDENVHILRNPRREPPSVWEYYYRLAAIVVDQKRQC